VFKKKKKEKRYKIILHNSQSKDRSPSQNQPLGRDLDNMNINLKKKGTEDNYILLVINLKD